jgi:hypothetical protein
MKNKNFARFLPPIIWMALIFIASSQHKVGMGGNYWVSFTIFKTLHMIIYGSLYTFWRLALHSHPHAEEISILISFVYGITDEIHQLYVPTRGGTFRDVVINLIGIIIFYAYLSEFIIQKLKKNKLFQEIYNYKKIKTKGGE